MRWSEEEYQQFLRRGAPSPITEKAFLAAIIRLARQNNYLYYHTHNSKRSPEGFPDLVLAKAGAPLLCIELKTDTGQVTPAQAAWWEVLRSTTGVVAEVWRPRDLDDIVERLRRQA